MTTATKFKFDMTFDTVEPIDSHSPEPDAAPPEPTYSAEELAAARSDGYREGREAGLSEGNASIESAASQALTQIAVQIESLGPVCQSGLDQCRHEAIGIAHAIGRKMVAASVQDTALQAIEEILDSMLARVLDEPRVVIRVHNDILDSLQQRLPEVTGKCGFPGSIILLSEADLEITDCRVEWADGGADFKIDTILEEIDTMIERYRAGIMTDAAATDSDEQPQPASNSETTETDIEEQTNG